MGGKLFNKLRANFEQVCQELPDTRRAGHSLQYTAADFIKCAFAVFFFQHQSLLDFQRQMKEQLGRNSLETVFGVSETGTKRTNSLPIRYKTPNRRSGRSGNGTDGIIRCTPASG